MSKIIFVKNSEDVEKFQFEVFKSKPIERTDDGKIIEQTNDEADEIMQRKNLSIEQAIRCLRIS